MSSEREREIAQDILWMLGMSPHHDLAVANHLARYRAELTSDVEVLRRAEQTLREAGVCEVLLFTGAVELSTGHGASTDVAEGTLAEAVTALKETP